MQRQPYPPNAASPPLHHPVPQHVSTVPMMRSPPPPQSMAGNQYAGSPYGGGGQMPQQGGGGPAQYGGPVPGFDNFMNNPTAAMGMQFGQSAAAMGAQYLEANAGRWFSLNALKHYFNVTTSYVLRKLILVLFPWQHKPWARQQRPSAGGQESGYYYLPPREDINSPDMYIPVMSFVTFILLSALLAGLRGDFHPELMGSNFGWAFGTVVLDIVILKLGTYFLSINEQSQLLDMIAYSGYKFVGVIATLIIAEIFNLGQGTGGWVGWGVFIYTFNANAFFLLRSLRYVLLPESSSSGALARSQKSQRTYFLFGYSYVVQLLFMWVLSRQSNSGRTLKA